jgi:hypothetical protein
MNQHKKRNYEFIDKNFGEIYKKIDKFEKKFYCEIIYPFILKRYIVEKYKVNNIIEKIGKGSFSGLIF